MIAPVLPQGLTIHFTGKVLSKPYIDMTLALMEMAGIKIDRKGTIFYWLVLSKFLTLLYIFISYKSVIH